MDNHEQQQSNDNNKKVPNEKATQAYKLFDEGKKPVEVAIQYSDCVVHDTIHSTGD